MPLTIEKLRKAKALLDEAPTPDYIVAANKKAFFVTEKDLDGSMRWNITSSIDRENGFVMLDTEDYAGKITREIMRTKEEAIRNALIALGWTPPLEPPKWIESHENTQNHQ